MNIRTLILIFTIATTSLIPTAHAMDLDAPPAKVCPSCMTCKAFEGDNPIHKACLLNHPTCIQALLENEVRWFGDQEPRWVNQINAIGWTPLHSAACDGNVQIVQILLNAQGINVDAISPSCGTPLCLGVNSGHIPVVQTLIARPGVDVNVKTWAGTTLLHRTAKRGNAQMVQTLLAAGANPTMLDWKKRSPRDLAISHGHTVIANILREAEATFRARTGSRADNH